MKLRTILLLGAALICVSACVQQNEAALDLRDALVVDDIEGGRARSFEHLTAVAQCMALEGFEYVPYPGQHDDDSMLRRYSAYSTPIDFLREHGYGLVMEYRNVLEHFRSDPNQEIVRGLSEADRAAYYEALVGDHGDGGCFEQVIGSQQRTMEEFGLKLNEMLDRFMQDERVIAAIWASCMELRELRYESPETAKTAMSNRMALLDATDLDTALSELGPIELEVASADADCRTGLDYDLLLHEYEQRFAIANADLVADMARALQGE